MANLTQAEKDQINARIDELSSQGVPYDQIKAEADALEAQILAGKQNISEDQADTSGDVDSNLEDGSSELQEGIDETWGKFTTDAQGKRYYSDNDGEINAIAGETGALVSSIPFFGDVIDDIYGAYKQGRAQARSVDDALNLFKEGADVTEDDLQEYLQRVKEMEGTRVSQEMKDFNKAYEESGGGAWGFTKAIATNPQAAFETMVSSLVAMVNPASAAQQLQMQG